MNIMSESNRLNAPRQMARDDLARENNMKSYFRVIALLEALSWFALIFTMYLKYGLDQPEPNQVTGMAHGILSVMYVGLALLITDEIPWSRQQLMIVLIASLIPGATIYVERRMMA